MIKHKTKHKCVIFIWMHINALFKTIISKRTQNFSLSLSPSVILSSLTWHAIFLLNQNRRTRKYSSIQRISIDFHYHCKHLFIFIGLCLIISVHGKNTICTIQIFVAVSNRDSKKNNKKKKKTNSEIKL